VGEIVKQLCPSSAAFASEWRMLVQGRMNDLQFFATYGTLCKELDVKFR
jgi:hypothetical protein